MTLFHTKSLVESEHVGEGTRVWANAHVMHEAIVGRDCNVGEGAFVEAGARVGNNVTLKNHVCVWDGVVIEDDVFVGPHVAFTNDPFPRSPRMLQVRQRYSDRSRWLKPTLVERGASIGANATVLPGVTIGAYSLIGAGAVVTRNVPAFALVIGSPARQVDDVCRCGQPLAGNFHEVDCVACGETAAERLAALEMMTQAVGPHD